MIQRMVHNMFHDMLCGVFVDRDRPPALMDIVARIRAIDDATLVRMQRAGRRLFDSSLSSLPAQVMAVLDTLQQRLLDGTHADRPAVT